MSTAFGTVNVARTRTIGVKRKKASEPSVRTKAGRRKVVARPSTRKKAVRRKKKPRIGDPDSSTQAEALQLLVDRLEDIYARADATVEGVQQEIQDKIEDLGQHLAISVGKVTSTICDDINDLLAEIEERSDELRDRDDQ